tara:strand:- start:813 stop:1010 length:198 start_codon:yes stop_codon:yes gene_type:complete
MKDKTRALIEKLSDRDSVLEDADLRELLVLASLGKINIFTDHNNIIKRLCAELLKARGLDPWRTP